MAQVENNFMVALNGVSLSEAQKKKINSGIQEVVMRELAQIDHTEMIVKRNNPAAPISTGNIPFIWGIKVDLRDRILNVVRQSQAER